MDSKQIGACILGGLVIASGAAIAGHYINPQIQIEQLPGQILKEDVRVEVPIEVPRDLTQIEKDAMIDTFLEAKGITRELIPQLKLDSENLDLVLDFIYDNKGDVEFVIDDLDEDEVNEIAARISFANEIKNLAFDKVKNKAFDKLDGKLVTVNGIEVKLDEDDLEDMDMDIDDVSIDGNIDFEDKDAFVLVPIEFEQEDIEYKAIFRVEINNGLVDEVDIVSYGE